MPSVEISRYFLDNHQHCSCFPSHPASVLFLGESQVIFLLFSFLSNPQFSPFLTPSHSVFLSLPRRIISSLYISRSVAVASVILRRLALSLQKAHALGDSDLHSSSLKALDSRLNSDSNAESNSNSNSNSAIHSILSTDPLFQKIPPRRISDIIQLNQRNLLRSTEPSTSFFPSFFSWYLSHSHGPLLDLLTAVSITSSDDLVSAHLRLRFREFLYSKTAESSASFATTLFRAKLPSSLS